MNREEIQVNREEIQKICVYLLYENKYKHKNKCFWNLYDSKH